MIGYKPVYAFASGSQLNLAFWTLVFIVAEVLDTVFTQMCY